MTEHELKNIQIVNSCLDALLQWDATGVAPCDDVEEYLHHILDNITPVAEQLGLHKEQRDIQDLPVEERPIGGLGIMLVSKIASKVKYSRENESHKLALYFSIK